MRGTTHRRACAQISWYVYTDLLRDDTHTVMMILLLIIIIIIGNVSHERLCTYNNNKRTLENGNRIEACAAVFADIDGGAAAVYLQYNIMYFLYSGKLGRIGKQKRTAAILLLNTAAASDPNEIIILS